MHKCVPQEGIRWAPKFEERTQDETLKQERCARRDAWNLAKDVYKLKMESTNTFFSLAEGWVMLAPSSQKPEEQESVVDSGGSIHMLSIKDLGSDEMETLRRSRNTTVVVTAKGEVQTNGKHKYTFTIFISSWRCKYSMTRLQFYHLESSTKSTDTLISGPMVKSHIWPKRCEENPLQANSGSNDEAPGNWRVEAVGSSEGLPEWLQDFIENLEIVEMPAVANISRDSDPERLIKVASRKAQYFCHFPKDQTCEVCKRTKITRAPLSRGTSF